MHYRWTSGPAQGLSVHVANKTGRVDRINVETSRFTTVTGLRMSASELEVRSELGVPSTIRHGVGADKATMYCYDSGLVVWLVNGTVKAFTVHRGWSWCK